jgi:ABC-2 type transport system permease protein
LDSKTTLRLLKLSLLQVNYERISFWRNPAAAFFTFSFPIIFLVILNLVFKGKSIEISEGTVPLPVLYVPMIMTFSAVSASYTALAMNLTLARDRGILKRIRKTPLPTFAFLSGKICHSVITSAILIMAIFITGVLFFDTSLPVHKVAPFIITLIVGAATFSALGIAATIMVPNSDSAPAVVNGSILPLFFISDVFIPMDNAPTWLNIIANIFPVRPFSLALQKAFNPLDLGSGFDPISLIIMMTWMIAGVLISVKYFSWQPRI